MENNQTKICSKCKVEQGLSCFAKSGRGKNGLRSDCKKCFRRYEITNSEKIAARKKAFYIANKKTMNAIKKIYNEKNKEALAKRRIVYREENKEAIAYRQKIYDKSPAGVASRKNTKYKRRSKERQGDVTTQQLLELEQSAKVCYWCNCSLKKAKVHIDHYVPLSRGGEHTLSNLVVSCAICNRKKFAKSPYDFANSVGKLL